MKNYTIRDIAEIGIFVGLALVLNLPVFTIHIMSGAGSISFCLVPLFIIALRKSWWKTLIASSVVFGLLACLIDGYGFVTYPLDYLCAYGSIVVVSLLRRLILRDDKVSYLYLIVGVITATCLRIMFSTISGVVIYQFTFLASITYNAIYISITGAVTLAILLLLLKPLKILNNKYPGEKEIQ